MTDKVEVRFRVRPEVKHNMDMIYNALHKSKHRDKAGHWTKDFSMNMFWEMAINRFLVTEENREILLFFKKQREKVV
jgi:hypothetical protein